MTDLPRRHPAASSIELPEGPAFDAPLPPADDALSAPDADIEALVLSLVISLRGWAELVDSTRTRRYRSTPAAPGAIALGEVIKNLRQAANLCDNHTPLLARDLRR